MTHHSYVTFAVVWVSFLSAAHVYYFLAVITLLFTWAEQTHDLIETFRAGGSNAENGEIGDQERYHHGTKETNFVFLGFW